MKKPPEKGFILVGDLVNSTKSKLNAIPTVAEKLKNYATPNRIALFRGDGFQAWCTDQEQVLACAIHVQLELAKLSTAARIAIGYGEINFKRSMGQSTGTAFERSGRLLDGMKSTGELLQIDSNHPIDVFMNTLLGCAGDFIKSMTPPMAEAAAASLSKPLATQEEIATDLGTTQAALSKRLSRASYSRIQEILALFKSYKAQVWNS